MTRRILITGATGTVGAATLRELAAHAAPGALQILGATRSSAGAARLREAGIAPVLLDYDRPETLRPALEGVDAAFLVTGYTVDMLVHSKRFLDAARAAGVGHIVHLGAHAADDTPHAHFAWHQMVERTVEAMGFGHTHLRPNFFMDNVWQGFRARPERLVHFVGDRRVSFVASDDIGAVAAAVLRDPQRHAGKTYPLAAEALSFPELAALLAEVSGRPVTYQPRPAASLAEVMQRQGAEPLYAAGLVEGIAAIEAGELPLADAVFDTIETITARPATDWRRFARARLAELAPAAG